LRAPPQRNGRVVRFNNRGRQTGGKWLGGRMEQGQGDEEWAEKKERDSADNGTNERAQFPIEQVFILSGGEAASV